MIIFVLIYKHVVIQFVIIFVLINKHVVIQHFVTLVTVFNYFELKIATTCIFAKNGLIEGHLFPSIATYFQ